MTQAEIDVEWNKLNEQWIFNRSKLKTGWTFWWIGFIGQMTGLITGWHALSLAGFLMVVYGLSYNWYWLSKNTQILNDQERLLKEMGKI